MICIYIPKIFFSNVEDETPLSGLTTFSSLTETKFTYTQLTRRVMWDPIRAVVSTKDE